MLSCHTLKRFTEGKLDHEQQGDQVPERQELEKYTPTPTSALFSLQRHNQLFDKLPVTAGLGRELRRLTPEKRLTFLLRLHGLVTPIGRLVRFPVTHARILSATSMNSVRLQPEHPTEVRHGINDSARGIITQHVPLMDPPLYPDGRHANTLGHFQVIAGITNHHGVLRLNAIEPENFLEHRGVRLRARF